jgi:cytochrome c
VCDKAAIAIQELLGGNAFADGGMAMSGAPFQKVRDDYPKWREWDKNIAELQTRLDAGAGK